MEKADDEKGTEGFILSRPFKLFLALLFAGTLPADPPPGYYDPAAGLTGLELQQALHDIIDDHDCITYDDVWLAFYTTDDLPGGYVWDMYSDVPGGTPPYLYELGNDQGGSASGEGEGYNREHSWPKSWFGGEVLPMYTDMFQIVPSDIYVNNRRGNYPYGEVNAPTWVSMNGSMLGSCSWPGYSGTVFEPIDGYKGDFARNYFYMATRYLGEDSGWPGSPMTDGAVLYSWAEEMLICWHLQDPVSDKETDRNEAVYAIQNNRNPYIDHPEFVLSVYDPASVEPQGTTIEVAMLQQNSPNPFSSGTSIRFTLSRASVVSLEVLDFSGRLVRTIVAEEQLPEGQHSFTWDGGTFAGNDPPAGIYFCRLTTEEGCSTVTMLKL